MKFFPFFLSALFLVAFSFPSLGQEAGDVGDDSKKIRLMDSATELANSFEDEIHRQVDQSVLNSAQLKFMRPKSIKTFPILWQSYLWMEYDLNEEVIMIAAVTTEAGEIRSLLIRATRSPYRDRLQHWKVEWSPDTLFDGTLRYEWEDIGAEKMRISGAVLEWCKERGFFERLRSIGNPLIQRWIFNYNWEKGLGRRVNKQESDILLSSILAVDIIVPLPDKK